ncbi:MAG: replication-associated recombination protein A [Erysipelotrichaceae bacterium]|nr:replication-associated recombination protein A [Erysipelotrichaceae bacterium]
MPDLLAIKLRPTKLSEVIGQKHLIGENKVLSNLIKNKKLFSMILYGNPGIGKTSIANAIVSELDVRYRMLNAVINNKKDFDTVVEEAKLYQGMVLIMDEIHRLNKDKQDLLLPYLENGLITLIGMTTSNPYHSINPAIRSRCQIFELHELESEDIKEAINRVIKSNYLENLTIDKDAINFLVEQSNHDLRYTYNLIEVAYYASNDHHLTLDLLHSIGGKGNIFIDKNGDGYYNTISAFQKSIRGSDVHASLYYLALLIEAGDIDIICRRLSVIVYEDIGLANPSMGPKVDAAINCALRLGLPEARIPLAEVVIELALSPKSNSAESAIDRVLHDIHTKNTGSVPKHIINHSPDYKYPHDYPNDYVKQQYLPNEIKGAKYYIPKNNKNEKILKEIMERLSKL